MRSSRISRKRYENFKGDTSMAYLWHKCFVCYSDYGAQTEVNACTWRMLNVRYIAVASGGGGGGRGDYSYFYDGGVRPRS